MYICSESSVSSPPGGWAGAGRVCSPRSVARRVARESAAHRNAAARPLRLQNQEHSSRPASGRARAAPSHGFIIRRGICSIRLISSTFLTVPASSLTFMHFSNMLWHLRSRKQRQNNKTRRSVPWGSPPAFGGLAPAAEHVRRAKRNLGPARLLLFVYCLLLGVYSFVCMLACLYYLCAVWVCSCV